MFFKVFWTTHFFLDFKFLISRKSFSWLEILIPGVNPVLGAEFHESKFKIAISWTHPVYIYKKYDQIVLFIYLPQL